MFLSPFPPSLLSLYISPTYRYQESCCAATSYSDKSPDLSSLSIYPNSSCNSLTAPFIATALCAGQESCSFNVSANQIYSIPLSSVLAQKLVLDESTICQRIYTNSAGVRTCDTTLAHGGNFANCGQNRALAVGESQCVSVVLVLSVRCPSTVCVYCVCCPCTVCLCAVPVLCPLSVYCVCYLCVVRVLCVLSLYCVRCPCTVSVILRR